MLADRDFMQTQLEAANEHSGRLALALERMRRRVAAATGVEPGESGWQHGLLLPAVSPALALVACSRVCRTAPGPVASTRQER